MRSIYHLSPATWQPRWPKQHLDHDQAFLVWQASLFLLWQLYTCFSFFFSLMRCKKDSRISVLSSNFYSLHICAFDNILFSWLCLLFSCKFKIKSILQKGYCSSGQFGFPSSTRIRVHTSAQQPQPNLRIHGPSHGTLPFLVQRKTLIIF